MIEILAGDLDQAIADLKLAAKKTYQCQKQWWEYQENYQVWEISEIDFEFLCEVDKSNWKDNWGWWRYSDGSIMGTPVWRYNINNHYLYAWDGYRRDQFGRENKGLPKDDKWFQPRKYRYLIEYLCEEHGISTEKNVCALTIDLAKYNKIKLSELWQKYQG